jgi:hypothetical protein
MFMLTEPNLVCCLLISFLSSQKSDAVLERHEIGLEFERFSLYSSPLFGKKCFLLIQIGSLSGHFC